MSKDIQPYIVTFFNGPNCGAFLQAFASGRVMKGLTGQDAIYIDTGARSIERWYRSQLKRAIKELDLSLLKFASKKKSVYRDALKGFKVEAPRNEYGFEDLILFGSDEVWNISREKTSAYPMLWGEGINGGFKFAYAPSSNGADFSHFAGAGGFAANIREFQALSARDGYTAAAIGELVGDDIRIVCDPTFLLDIEDYRSLQNDSKRQGYVLVYSYGNNMTADDIADIKAFAKRRGLKLISADQRLSWCDESLPCGPFGFLGLMDGADFVITDTFHGSVFATIYHKRFASYARSKSKVCEYLRQVSLENRNPSASGGLEACLTTDVDYGVADGAIEALRTASAAYLKDMVDCCKFSEQNREVSSACIEKRVAHCGETLDRSGSMV